MKSRLISLFSFSKATELKQGNDKSTEHNLVKSIWQDTGLTYYLFDTLKLTIETQDGTVSFEKVSVEKLEALISGVRDGSLPHICPKQIAGSVAMIYVSLCGATWQKLGEKRRIKAIPDAATLTITLGEQEMTQAVFKSEGMSKGADLTSGLPTRLSEQGFSYINITFRQFIEQLKVANDSLPTGFTRGLYLGVNNFSALFTNNESRSLASFSTSYG